jgi:hypothetical protein
MSRPEFGPLTPTRYLDLYDWTTISLRLRQDGAVYEVQRDRE